MKKLFVFTMLFSLIMAFSPPEKVVQVNVSDDICAVSQDYSIDVDIEMIAGMNPVLINEAEVEISPGVNNEVFMTSTEVNSRTLESHSSMNYPKLDYKAKSSYILNQKILEISPGDNQA